MHARQQLPFEGKLIFLTRDSPQLVSCRGQGYGLRVRVRVRVRVRGEIVDLY